MFKDSNAGFIGGGNMGEALIKGLLSASLFHSGQIHVYDVSGDRLAYLKDTYGIPTSSGIEDLARSCDIIVLAVKPQTMSAVLSELKRCITGSKLVISIAAGVPIQVLLKGLPDGTPVIRVMPNTPALVLQGASALSRGPGVTDSQMRKALSLFQAVGTAMEVEEKLMDTVTGLSGSGPAYFLLLLESFIDAGVLMGLPRPVARELVLQTAAGTVKMARESSRHLADLKDMITSPGGTTISGLQVLENRAVRGAVFGAVEAATLRSKELGKG
jgi:pyrroline-5-carboxylate reductase